MASILFRPQWVKHDRSVRRNTDREYNDMRVIRLSVWFGWIMFRYRNITRVYIPWYYNDVKWDSCCPKSSTTRIFVQQLDHSHQLRNFLALIYKSFVRANDAAWQIPYLSHIPSNSNAERISISWRYDVMGYLQVVSMATESVGVPGFPQRVATTTTRRAVTHVVNTSPEYRVWTHIYIRPEQDMDRWENTLHV